MNKKIQRQNLIYQLLTNGEKLRVKDIASQLQVTPETVRNDLREMEQRKQVIREHGYARSVSTLDEVPIRIRQLDNLEQKKRISYQAFRLIQDDQIIWLDASSTIALGIPMLASHKNLTVVTDGIPQAYQTSLMNIRTILCGGPVSNVGLRTSGNDIINMIDRVHFDIAFLGSDGLKNARGFTALNYDEIAIKSHLLIQSDQIVVAMDTSKFDKKAGYKICDYKDVDILVTNTLTKAQKEIVYEIPKIIEV